MTSAERPSEYGWAAPEVPVPPEPVVMDTSEVRWFASGSLPGDVLSWFVGLTTITVIDERTDRYLIHGIPGLGVKYRAQRMLEVKRLHSVEGDLSLGHGLSAEVMRWQKWCPEQLDPAWTGPDVGHVDVHKVVLKAGVVVDGGVVMSSDGQHEALVPACNVELASVKIDGVASWTLGLEATGPLDLRRRTLLESWAAISDGSLPDIGFGSRFEIAAAYPDWLDRQLPYELAG